METTMKQRFAILPNLLHLLNLLPTTTTSTTTTAMITTEDDQLRIEYPDIIYDPSTPTTHHGYNQPLVYFERCILLSSSINKHCENNLN
jgi:hypothetical protein